MRLICLIALLFVSTVIRSQESIISEIEDGLKNSFGYEKLVNLNKLSDHYSERNIKKAIRYGKQATDLSKNLYSERNALSEDESLALVESHFFLGRSYFLKEDFVLARTELQSAKVVSEKFKRDIYEEEIGEYLKYIEESVEDGNVKDNVFKKTFSKIKVGEAVRETRKDINIETQISRAKNLHKTGQFDEAIDAYTMAINLLRDKGNTDRIADLQLQIAILLDSLGRYSEDLSFLQSLPLDTVIGQSVLPAGGTVFSIPAIKDSDIDLLEESISASRKEKENLKKLSSDAVRKNNIKEAINYLERYQQLSQRILRDSIQSEVYRKEKEQAIVFLQQQKRIAEFEVKDAKIGQDKQRRIKNFISLITGLLVILAGVIFYFYSSKRKEHIKLTSAYADLDQTKGRLEKVELKIKRMLNQQVSSDVAATLLDNPGNLGESKFAAILFLDIQGFTPIVEKMNPKELIAYQNKVFGFMIDTIEEYQGNVNQLMGDGFMATFGAPITHGNDCQHAFQAANDILEKVKYHSRKGDIPETEVRIGIHAGNVVTGNVGNETRKQFSVTGNAVITSARLEQLNKNYGSSLIVSKDFFDMIDKSTLEDSFTEEKVDLKGRKEKLEVVIFNEDFA